MDNFTDIEAKLGNIARLESAGDTITHQVIAQLNRSFITPFDREDIAALGNRWMISQMLLSPRNDICRYKVGQPTQRARELADLLVNVTGAVEKSIPLLRRVGDLKKIPPRTIEINRLEAEVDIVYRKAMAELFENPPDYCHVIKWHEIYEHMESASDRCEDVSNVLEGIALKNA